MKIRDLINAIIVIACMIFCYWKFDSKIVTASIMLACSLLNFYKIVKKRSGK